MDLNKLEELARAATPGPWVYTGEGYGDNGELYGEVMDDDHNEEIVDEHGMGKEDAQFIAAANPAAILDLISLVRKQETALTEIQGRMGALILAQEATVKESLNVAGELPPEQIKAIFMAHGFTIKEGQTDLKPYVYEAARALIAAARPAIWYEGCDTALAHGPKVGGERARGIEHALRQIVAADDAQAMTQQLIDIGRAALEAAEGTGGAAPAVDLSGLRGPLTALADRIEGAAERPIVISLAAADSIRALLAAAPVAEKIGGVKMSPMICPKCGADLAKEKCNYGAGCVMAGAVPATPVKECLTADALIPDQAEDIFDLIREWAHLPEGSRGDAARNIIGCLNKSYSAGVKDGREAAALATPPASAQAVVHNKHCGCPNCCQQAVAPAQVEQEPVAEVSGSSQSDAGWHAAVRWLERGKEPIGGTKLYTRPQAAQPASATVAQVKPTGVRKTPYAFSCKNAVPNSYYSACEKFCGCEGCFSSEFNSERVRAEISAIKSEERSQSRPWLIANGYLQDNTPPQPAAPITKEWCERMVKAEIEFDGNIEAGADTPWQWLPGPDEFKGWCSKYFGPDADETYLAQAVFHLPAMAQKFKWRASQQPAAQVAGMTDAEPDMLWYADNTEGIYGNDAEDFARSYAECNMAPGDISEITIECAKRLLGRKMYIEVTADEGDWLKWRWMDDAAILAAQSAPVVEGEK